MSLIEFQNVSFSYGTDEGEEKVDVIENLNLNIEKGSFTAVLGHNGSGNQRLLSLQTEFCFRSREKLLLTVPKQSRTTVFLTFVKKWVWFFKIPIIR